jgi:hypothetical protein
VLYSFIFPFVAIFRGAQQGIGVSLSEADSRKVDEDVAMFTGQSRLSKGPFKNWSSKEKSTKEATGSKLNSKSNDANRSQ